MRYTGSGTIDVTIKLRVDINSSGDDLDDAYGPAGDDLEGIVDEIRIGLDEIIKLYNDAAEKYGASLVHNYELDSEYNIEQLDNSGEVDRAYDQWRDEQMMRGMED